VFFYPNILLITEYSDNAFGLRVIFFQEV